MLSNDLTSQANRPLLFFSCSIARKLWQDEDTARNKAMRLGNTREAVLWADAANASLRQRHKHMGTCEFCQVAQ